MGRAIWFSPGYEKVKSEITGMKIGVNICFLVTYGFIFTNLEQELADEESRFEIL